MTEPAVDVGGAISVTAGTEDAGCRLDAFIGYNTDELSRSYAVKLIERGNVTVNGKTVTSKKHALKAGDVVDIDLPEPEKLDVLPEDIPLEIVYEDDDVLVVNKPRGMVVHPGPGNWSGTLVNAVMYHCGDSLSSINGVIRPGIVHRIDKDTSGLLMIAKNNAAHESLAEQLRVHSVTREYTALCYDNIQETGTFGVSGVKRESWQEFCSRNSTATSAHFSLHNNDKSIKNTKAVTADYDFSNDNYADTGSVSVTCSVHPADSIITIDVPIGRDERNRMRQAVNGAACRNAVTHIRVIERFGRYSLVKARLETGRTHQIRVHMAYIHHPLVGDELYGPRRQSSSIEGIKISGQLLHAGTLGFVHPSTGEYMEFHSELPEVFSSILAKLH